MERRLTQIDFEMMKEVGDRMIEIRNQDTQRIPNLKTEKEEERMVTQEGGWSQIAI